MTISEFIRMFSTADDDFVRMLLAEEEYHCRGEQVCKRKDAARILHCFLSKIKRLPDLTAFSKLSDIKDLYDCRICANSIAQVLLRGIMDPARIPTGDRSFITIFDLESKITREEAEDAISRVRKI